MLTGGVGNLGIQTQAAVVVVTKDTDMDTSLRDRLVRMLIPNNVGRGGQTASTSLNIRDNKEMLNGC